MDRAYNSINLAT